MGDLTKTQTAEPITITDGNTNTAGVTAAAPLGTEAGLIVRSIQSGIGVNNKPGSSSYTQSVASSATSVNLLPANPYRINVVIYNASSAILYVKFGSVASTSDYTVQIAVGASYTTPERFAGQIDGIWASANGNAIITELSYVGFSANPASGTAPLTVLFTDESAISATSWSWSFGDGNTSTGSPQVTNTYLKSGSYIVTLTLSNALTSATVMKRNLINIIDPLDKGPRWGINNDPSSEAVNQGEGAVYSVTGTINTLLNTNPQIVRSPSGALLMFFNAAVDPSNSTTSIYAIRMKKSTDNGVTWGPTTTVYEFSAYMASSSYVFLGGVVADLMGLVNPPSVTVIFGQYSSSLHSGAGGHYMFQTRTTNDGTSWSARVDITTATGNSGTYWYNTATSTGIQLSAAGSNVGRLIMPCAHRTNTFTGNGTIYSHVIKSDDGGVTWAILGGLTEGAGSNGGTNTCCIIETTTPNKLLMNCSQLTTTSRYQSTSTNGGTTWVNVTVVSGMTQVASNASLIRFNGMPGNTNILALASTYDPASAVLYQMSVWYSTDEGTTWINARTIFYRYANNCGMCALDGEHGLLAFESGNDNAASLYYQNGYWAQEISLVTFNRTWLFDGSGATMPYADYFLNEDASGALANAYGESILDYGGTFNAKATVLTKTNPPSYNASGIAVSSSTADAILLSPPISNEFQPANGDNITYEVEATIQNGGSGTLITNTNNDTGFLLDCYNNNLRGMTSTNVGSPAPPPTTVQGTTVINDGVRRIYTLVRDASYQQLRIYINGNFEASTKDIAPGDLRTSTNLSGPGTGGPGIVAGQSPNNGSAFVGAALAGTIHSIRITRAALISSQLQSANRTKTTPNQFRNYTPPSPSFTPTSISNLKLWLDASVDGAASAYGDSYWHSRYPLPCPVSSVFRSIRDKSANSWFFSGWQTGNVIYSTDAYVGPYYRHVHNSSGTAYWQLTRGNYLDTYQPNTIFDFIQSTGVFTIALAVKFFTNTGSQQIVLDSGNNSTSNAGFTLSLDITGSFPFMKLQIGPDNIYSYIFNSGIGNAQPSITIGNWYFMMFVGNGRGNTPNMYYTMLDGTLLGPTPYVIPCNNVASVATIGTPTHSTTTYAPLTVGCRSDLGAGFADIGLKNIVIYSTALTQANADSLAMFNVSY